MRNRDISNKILIRYLRDRAVEDATEQEYHPEEHTAWMSADRIEDLQDMVDGKDDGEVLRAIANRLVDEKFIRENP